MEPDSIVRFGTFELDSACRELRCNGVALSLSPRSFRALSYLIEHRDRIVSKNEFMSAIWPDSIVSEASLSTALKELRQAIGDDGQRQRWVKTVRGHGFRFVGEVEDTAAPTAIAVLPFLDLSPRGDQGYVADSIAEELINALAQIRQLRVTARTSSFSFKGKNLDICEIGRQLGVGAIVEGSIQLANGRLRVTTQLVETVEGFHLWSDSREHPVGELFALQDEVINAVADRLHVKIARRALRPPTGDLRAYELCVRGMAFFHEYNPKSLLLGLAYFERALEIDPNYAVAHLGIACVLDAQWSLQPWFPEIKAPDWTANSPLFQRAFRAAKRAAELDSDLSGPHGELGYLYFAGHHDVSAAEREFKLEEKLNPGSLFSALDWSMLKSEVGELEEAMSAVDRARRLDPLSPYVNHTAGITYYLSGQYDLAIELLRDSEGAGHGTTPYLAMAYVAAGRPEELFQLILAGIPPNAPEAPRKQLESCFEQDGLPGLLKFRIELGRISTRDLSGNEPHLRTAFFAALGESDNFFTSLEAAEQGNHLWYPKSEPLFAPYRDDPRFVAMLERRGVL